MTMVGGLEIKKAGGLRMKKVGGSEMKRKLSGKRSC